MPATVDSVVVALFFVLQTGAPARFPVSKLACEGGRRRPIMSYDGIIH